MNRRRIFNLSELQEQARQNAREFGMREIVPILKELDKEPPEFPFELYKKIASSGFIGYTTSTELGGLGKSWLEYTALIEEICYFDASVGFIISISNLAIMVIELFGTDDQKREFLPGLISGDMIGAFALTEPCAGSDVNSIKTQAVLQGDEFVVNGEKLFISSGDVADVILLVCRTVIDKDEQIGVLIVETDSIKGLERRILKNKMGLKGSTTAHIIFKGSHVPKKNLVGEPGQGFRIAMKSLDYSRVAIAAQAVGLGQACFDRATEYAKKREAYGAPIARLSSIQGMIADMSCRLEAARLLTYKAAWMMDRGLEFNRESAQAKLFASEAVNFIADRAVQIHGGYGYVGEFSDIEKLYRDARVIPIYEGTSEIQKIVIARKELK